MWTNKGWDAILQLSEAMKPETKTKTKTKKNENLLSKNHSPQHHRYHNDSR